MIRINLLPKERIRRVRISPRTITIIVAVTVVVALAAVTLYLDARNARVQRESEQVQAEIDTLRPQVARVLELERQIAGLREKQQLLQRLESARVQWSTVFVEITQIIPRDVWVTQLTTAADGAVVITGRALSYTAVARFMVNLDSSPVFDAVDLSSTEKVKVGTRDVMTFALTARLTTTSQEASR